MASPPLLSLGVEARPARARSNQPMPAVKKLKERLIVLVRVRVYATLTHYLPGIPAGTARDVELPDGATALDLLQSLRLPLEEVKLVFVNGQSRPLTHLLSQDDEVGVFPAVGGG